MREKSIEEKLVGEVKRLGGMCPKFVSPGIDGMPDRIVLLKGGVIGFVELKSSGKKARPLQLKRLMQLRSLGFKAYVIDDVKKIAPMLEELMGGVSDAVRST